MSLIRVYSFYFKLLLLFLIRSLLLFYSDKKRNKAFCTISISSHLILTISLEKILSTILQMRKLKLNIKVICLKLYNKAEEELGLEPLSDSCDTGRWKILIPSGVRRSGWSLS